MIPRYTSLHFPNSSLKHSSTSSAPGKLQFLCFLFPVLREGGKNASKCTP